MGLPDLCNQSTCINSSFLMHLVKMLIDDFAELRMCRSSVFHMSSMTIVQLSYLRDLNYQILEFALICINSSFHMQFRLHAH